MVSALRAHFTPTAGPAVGEWTLLTEVPALAAPTRPDEPIWAAPTPDGETLEQFRARVDAHNEASKVRDIDVLLLRNWNSGSAGRERIAVEVKISRSDFFRDTAAKRAPWESLTHRFAYAVPAGLVTPAEVPPGCWLLEVSAGPCSCPRHVNSPRRVHWHPAVRGTRRRPPSLPDELVGQLARRAGEAEARLARPAELDTDMVAAQLAELRKLQLREADLRRQRDQLKVRLADLTRLVVEVSPQLCADCGEQLVPRASRYSNYRWAHRRAAADQPCTALRTAQADSLETAGGDGWQLRFGGLEPQAVRVNREEFGA